MDISITKILGYVLLAAGLIIIIVSMSNAYTVFSGNHNAPQVITLESITVSVPGERGSAGATVEIISGNVATKFANMLIWYVLMVFVMMGGSKIAGVGASLLREIKVVVKGEDSSRTLTFEG
ncbi:MAG: hypothetical protein WDL87_10735 [Candidatus Omnitrophota bacterium]|jgi:hypothetical protein